MRSVKSCPLSEHLVRGSPPPPPRRNGEVCTLWAQRLFFDFFYFSWNYTIPFYWYHMQTYLVWQCAFIANLSENPHIMVRHRFRNNLIQLLKFPRVLVSSLGWYLAGTGSGFVKYKSSPESDSIFLTDQLTAI